MEMPKTSKRARKIIGHADKYLPRTRHEIDRRYRHEYQADREQHLVQMALLP